MKQQTKRVQPYRTSDGDYLTLVEFALDAAKLLDSSYRPIQVWSDRTTEKIPDEIDITRFSYGEESTAIDIFHKKGYEPKAGGHVEDEVVVTCRGLPDSMSLELRFLKFYHDPRFIEIQVAGPDDAVEMILERFEQRFGLEHVPEEDEIRNTLRTAKSAVRVHAWRAAELNALEVLNHEPNNPEAMMYLGIARAAQGFEPEGENLLLSSLTLDPENVDAYYNLGLIVMKQGRCILASDAFRKVLSIEPENHPALYQLGRALERIGSFEEALEAYEQALQHSPNPDQAWAYTGMDFTEHAQDSIAQVKEAITKGASIGNSACK